MENHSPILRVLEIGPGTGHGIRAQEAIEAASLRVDSRQFLSIWLPVELVVAAR